MFSPKKKIQIERPKIPVMALDEEIPCNLLKDFKAPVTQNDFLKLKNEQNKNFGFLDEIMPLLYKNNKNVYYVKVIEKKYIINYSYKNILNSIYKIKSNNKRSNIYDFIINLQTHWEDSENLFLVFDGIKKYSLLENLLNNHTKYIPEEKILIIFRHILEIAQILHENNIFGCNLSMNSFIYDKHSQTIKLTDLGFSKIFKSFKNLNDSQLLNGSEFNEYYPPELINKMNDGSKKNDLEKLKNEKFDMWQLGILFYKIATFGDSPYDNEKDENLKDRIIAKDINYSKLNEYSPQITQIIDKMLQIEPSNRYSARQLLNLDLLKTINKIPLLNINSKNEDKPITINMINKEKEKLKDVKIDMATLLDDMEIKKKASKEINRTNSIIEEEEKMDYSNSMRNINKDTLNKIRIQGKLVNDKNTMLTQEIYPSGSVLPIFKNKILNKFNNIDNNLVLELSNKLNLLEKEYNKLNENKLAVYNITNYVNTNIKELNDIDKENIELLIKKFNSLKISNIETNDLYEEMLRNKNEFSQNKFKALISNLIYEIKKLEIDLDQEQKTGEKLKKKIKELEKKNLDTKLECQEKVEFYEKKIELLEEVIFSAENKSLDTHEDIKNNNKLIYSALTNSIKDFTDVNIKLKTSIEENLLKFKESKKYWLHDMITAKENFRNEMQFYLEKSMETPKIYNFEKKENKDISDKNEKDEKIKELTKKVVELNDLVNEQKLLVDHNTSFMKELKKELKARDDKIEELMKLLNNYEKAQ